MVSEVGSESLFIRSEGQGWGQTAASHAFRGNIPAGTAGRDSFLHLGCCSGTGVGLLLQRPPPALSWPLTANTPWGGAVCPHAVSQPYQGVVNWSLSCLPCSVGGLNTPAASLRVHRGRPEILPHAGEALLGTGGPGHQGARGGRAANGIV